MVKGSGSYSRNCRGDHRPGIEVNNFDKFEFDLQDTIASGGEVCRVVITKSD